MDLRLIVVVALVVLAFIVAAGLALFLGRRRSPATDHAVSEEAPSSSPASLEGVVATSEPAAVDLDAVMKDAAAVLYVPIDEGQRFLAVAHPATHVDGARSSVPTQLAATAVAGQAGLEAMVRAGQLSGRLVMVDARTAEAIRAGTIVTDKAGEMLGVIRGSTGRWSDLTRIKPLSGGLVRSASAGPAVLGAIAMQAQLAQVEKAISEVRDTVNAVKGYLEAAERAAVEGRRETLATVYRTAQESGQMTQALWDQIQGLEAPLRRDVRMADARLAAAVTELEHGASGLVGSRLRWLHGAGDPLAVAVAGVADARRSLVQFSMLRLWWLAATDDPTLASRQVQLREQLAELPDHVAEQERTEAVLAAAGELKTHHRLLAPRKHKDVDVEVHRAIDQMHELPWRIVDVRRAAELEP